MILSLYINKLHKYMNLIRWLKLKYVDEKQSSYLIKSQKTV